MKVKHRLPFIIVIMSTLPLIIIGTISYFLITDFSLKNYNTILMNQSDAAMKHLQDFYIDQKSSIEYTSNLDVNTSYLQALQSNDSQLISFHKQSVQELLDTVVRINDNVEDSMLVDTKGKIVVSSFNHSTNQDFTSVYPYIPYNGSPGSHDVYYQLIDEETKKILFYAPIFDSNDIILGALIQKVNTDYIHHYIRGLEIGDTGYLYVLDYNGNTLSHYFDDRIVLEPDTEDNIKSLQELMSSITNKNLMKNSGFLNYTISKKKIHAYYTVNESTGWVIVSAIPSSEVYKNSIQLIIYIFSISGLVITCSLFIGLISVRRILNPLSYFINQINSIAHGNFKTRCAYTGNDEFKDLCMHVNLMTDYLNVSYSKLEESAKTDILTNLPNRNSIYSTMDSLFDNEKNQACFLLDLDGFKNVNDSLGHDYGDIVLVNVANILSAIKSATVYPSRLGGDEFLVYIYHYDSLEELKELATHILSSINAMSESFEKPISVTGSIGIATIDEMDTNRSHLIKKADLAMYKIKDNGKSGILFFDYSMMKK